MDRRIVNDAIAQESGAMVYVMKDDMSRLQYAFPIGKPFRIKLPDGSHKYVKLKAVRFEDNATGCAPSSDAGPKFSHEGGKLHVEVSCQRWQITCRSD